MDKVTSRRIGQLQEKSLHAALKAHYAQPGDLIEHSIDGYVIDLVRCSANSPPQLIEIQTRGLGSLKQKLNNLLERYPLRLVHPIAVERHITRVDSDGVLVSRRKSPRHGTLFHVFPELVSLPSLLAHPHLALEVVLIHEEQIWRDDGQGSWRRKGWSLADRRLLTVVESHVLAAPADYAALLPDTLPPTFTTRDLVQTLRIPPAVAGKMAYCLRLLEVIRPVGKHRRAIVYQRA
ncbi:MAG: hypothetical protein HXY40_11975 [Chloroflexi bacterium]|nr:hypothetical protein [Chloroflexota bacterium]